MTSPGGHRSFTGSMGAGDLKSHILKSYFLMRLGAALLGIALPLILLFGGRLAGICPQDSISAYYHAVSLDGASVRTWFTGILFAVSAILGLYQGFSRAEDILLDLAGVLGIGIAIFPMPWERSNVDFSKCGIVGSAPYKGVYLFGTPLSAHVFCAVGFFICIAFICWFCADDTLDLIKEPSRRKLLKVIYRTIAILMPASMLAAWGLSFWSGHQGDIFWAETAGIWAFGIFWFIKGFELRATAADDLAAHGKLRLVEGRIERNDSGGA